MSNKIYQSLQTMFDTDFRYIHVKDREYPHRQAFPAWFATIYSSEAFGPVVRTADIRTWIVALTDLQRYYNTGDYPAEDEDEAPFSDAHIDIDGTTYVIVNYINYPGCDLYETLQ
jgi:hypothetical protein